MGALSVSKSEAASMVVWHVELLLLAVNEVIKLWFLQLGVQWWCWRSWCWWLIVEWKYSVWRGRAIGFWLVIFSSFLPKQNERSFSGTKPKSKNKIDHYCFLIWPDSVWENTSACIVLVTYCFWSPIGLDSNCPNDFTHRPDANARSNRNLLPCFFWKMLPQVSFSLSFTEKDASV